MTETIRFIITAVCIGLGGIIEIISFIGVFKYKDALSRMHAAGVGDTLAFFLIILGLVVHSGFTMLSLKLILALLLFWVASPVTSHMMARMLVNEKENEEDNK